MDKHDRKKKLLVVDEWGTWYDVEPGTIRAFISAEYHSRRPSSPAFTKAKVRRIRVANIAQTINVLQALILTQNEKMLLTPTLRV
jgi:alpha-N-arabinofuranosidase